MSLRLSSWAIRRPIPTLVLFLVLSVGGWLSFLQLPINANPRVEFPVITVLISQVGAAPTELEHSVTLRVERAVSGLAGIRHITSTVADGISVTTVEFQLGTDPGRAANDIRDAIALIRADLPQTIEEPMITRIDVEGGAILNYAVKGSARSLVELSWFVDDQLGRELLAVPGVQKVQRLGGVEREVKVELMAERLQALGITAEQVNGQLVQSNINVPGGRTQLASREQSIRTLGSAPTVQALSDTPIALGEGRWARLGELARVHDGASQARSLARLDGEEVVGFAVFRAKGSSDTRVAAGVETVIQRLQQQHPELEIRQISSSVDYTLASYDAALMTLVEGALLTVLVVLVFLRSWRATLVAAIALPLSILPTFAVIAGFGYSLNSITLLALTLVIGILVDDAIVEIENIERHLDQGKRPYQAAIDASDAIGFAVVAITATLVAVFLPVSFIGGFIGQYFTPFGITVSAAVLASLLVARLVTPLLAAYLLKPKTSGHGPRPVAPGGLLGRYLKLLEWALQHRRQSLGLAGLFLVGSFALVPLLPSGFMPVNDLSLSRIDVSLPPGTPLAQTDKALADMARQIRQRPEVLSVFVTAGGEDASGATDVASGQLLVRLLPADQRELGQKAFEQSLRPLLNGFADLRYAFRGETAARDLSIILVGPDGAALSQAAHAVQRDMRAIQGIANVQVNEPLPRPELLIQPRVDEAARAGVSAQAIGSVARIAAVGEINAGSARFNFPDRQVPIRVLLPAIEQGDLNALGNLGVSTDRGTVLPLSAVADIGYGSGPARIERFARLRRVSVDADLAGLTLGAALDAVGQLPALQQLPDGVRNVEYGDAEYMNEMFDKFSMVMGLGIMMVFAVLVLLFRDFLQPLTILTALPLSVGGALGGLLLYGAAIDLPVVIGLLMLMGIVTKNSILMVEFTLEKRRLGVPRQQALIRSGAERARPIVMTTIAMVAGMLPAALGSGADAGFRAPMAVAVIGGLVTSTLLSLVLVPVVFSCMDDLRQWLAPRLARLTSVTAQDRAQAQPQKP
ncbi:AcrB/AcrD/AcrF family protein [Pseudomonas sp. TKO26]|uniref:efflux RND transporter permease subunit n=1 Tax=unclassified Pseudomonas TaxID=196821 RepID=UPI000D8288DB|nr:MULTISPECIES: efflux RND transporter permease subunit [unclassified Pseudomonas]PYY88101.1 AcrB/AcrD/AcrF family protein [Pseudomonas sp. TKO30]PYY91084.1 AcrB/AcrD/AcrF family protein [Pseudomonas sp. TKO29]PYY93958.1 AcrB/AcrD/AcrF family protein [Pseudomonas sp. TKO26]PYZ00687.1 AcrB/AcrD/AcrF family protein [Pseudomonas sp. TKO14]